MHSSARILLGAIIILIAGCTPAPRAILPGTDLCEHCRMTVSDARFAAQIVSTTGKTFVFDSVECMAAFAAEASIDPQDVHSAWVTDFAESGMLISVNQAWFLQSASLQSPMGMNLAAFGPSTSPRATADSLSGRVLDWEEVQRLVSDRPLMAPVHAHQSLHH